MITKKENMTPKSIDVIKHIIEKPKDDWQYSIEKTIGDTKNRVVLKAKGDDLVKVLADMKALVQGSL